MKGTRLNTAETLGWSAVGFGLGVAGGLWAAGWLGRITRNRLADEIHTFQAPSGATPAALAESVREALTTDHALAALALLPVGIARGTVELTGWVPDRRSRARAVRLAVQVPGVRDIINSILVRGEDDLFPAADLTLEGRSA